MYVADCTGLSKPPGTSAPTPLKVTDSTAIPGTDIPTAAQLQSNFNACYSDEEMLKFWKEMSILVEGLKSKIVSLTKERDDLKYEVSQCKKIINSLNCKLNQTKSEQNSTVSKALNGLFTPNQVKAIVTQNQISSWKEEDISKAVTLKSLSPKAFRFIREIWKIPLPSSATISRWVSKLPVEPGLLHPVIRLLKDKASTMAENDRLCVVSFDETTVSQDWSFDMGTDTLYSPKSKVQCVMIRGLAKAWKQVVYYAFDTNMTRDILFDIILKVEAAGFVVVAMVSDLGSSNVSLWNSLGISVENTCFINPAASARQIYVFADAPHLLKLIRNNFLKHGFTFDGNSKHTVTDSSVREIIIRSEHDLKTAHHLSHKHINVQGVKTMNVKLAAQLMSETTAKSIKFFGEQGLLKSKDWDDTSKFIALVDAWFDVFNSRAPVDKKKNRVAFGIHLSEQRNILKSMMNTVQNMSVGRNISLYPFQKGILVSCQSLLKLYDFLNTEFGLKYIITYRLNQDGLEHFFGYLRQMGALYQHPNPVQVKYRVRSYLLGKNCELVGSNYNTEKENKEVSLSEMTYPDAAVSSDSSEDVSLESELMLSAMLFSSDPDFEIEISEPTELSFSVQQESLEERMEAEGLQYVGGFIAKKFPQYSFLGTKVTADDNTWIGEICREEGKLMTPSHEFHEKIKLMEKLFVCYHGTKSLKPGKQCMHNLSRLISRQVSLPNDVIKYFVRCRVFFRMRNLNRQMATTSKKVKNKMDKLMKKIPVVKAKVEKKTAEKGKTENSKVKQQKTK